ncbi:protein neprosin-like [Lolium perenne]|uniref:protein neprosin-like n=1 Tax=Lolium perenne TaxID=4522 RepID=UPI003A99DD82
MVGVPATEGATARSSRRRRGGSAFQAASSWRRLRVPGGVVHPALYKDSDTHFVTWWPGNGSHPGGCYNSQCPGFVRTGSSIAPGDVINPVSEVMGKKQYITIRASKHKSSGDWQIYYGFNGPAQLVGYFPKSLFPKLEKNQFNIVFGGYTSHLHTEESPPMGSGFFPGRSGASLYDIKFVDAQGSTHPVNGVLQPHATSPACYRVSDVVSGGFSYGGPGFCGALKSKRT